MSARGSLAVGMSSSSNIDTSLLLFWAVEAFYLCVCVCVCGIIVSNHHTQEEVIRSIKLYRLRCLFPLCDSVRKFKDTINSKRCQTCVPQFLSLSPQLTKFPQGPFCLDRSEIL